LAKWRGQPSLRALDAKNEAGFVEGVENHISGNYLEAGRAYGEKLLEIARQGNDNEGIFTTRKHILEIHIESRLAGFVVLTEKLGGSVKSGPVLLTTKYENRGYGKRLRTALHSVLANTGFRKVYATVPAQSGSARNYLIAAGYRVEAHLVRQYHEVHDELVLGYVLGEPDPVAVRSHSRDFLPLDRMERVRRFDGDIAHRIQEEFSTLISQLPVTWGREQLRAAVAHTRATTDATPFKIRHVYVAYSGSKIGALALCVVKRGGSAKIWLFTRAANASVSTFLAFMERSLSRTKGGVRKYYALTEISDDYLQRLYLESNYEIEGCLRRPYSRNSDYLVLSKLDAKYSKL